VSNVLRLFVRNFFEKHLGIQYAFEKIKLDKWGVGIVGETGVSNFGIW
jgi:hypothetical protein